MPTDHFTCRGQLHFRIDDSSKQREPVLSDDCDEVRS